MSTRTPHEFNQAVCPVLLEMGAALACQNPFQLPENSMEYERFRFLAVSPILCFAACTISLLRLPEAWKNEATSRCLAIAGDFSEVFRETICLYDLCPGAGEREEVTEWVRSSRGEALPPSSERNISRMICDLMPIRFPRFHFDYTEGIKFAKSQGEDHFSAIAFFGVARTFLMQISVISSHHTSGAVVNFSREMSQAAPEIVDTILREID